MIPLSRIHWSPKICIFGPKRANWDHLGPNMADNWFTDQLIWSVGLGARAVSRKTHIYKDIYIVKCFCRKGVKVAVEDTEKKANASDLNGELTVT